MEQTLNNNTVSNARIIYFDLLRIFSVFFMIALHVASREWYSTPVTSVQWIVFNTWDSLTHFCVPVFIMISGALFLNPKNEIKLKKLFGKNILRIVTAFIFWSAAYAVYGHFISPDKSDSFSAAAFLKDFLYGRYHLWFLFTIVGLYIITPLLRKITESKFLTKYYIIIFFIFTLCFNTLAVIQVFKAPVETISEKISIGLACGYSGYFVLGYYLANEDFSKTARKIIYALGVLSAFFTVTLSAFSSIKGGKGNTELLNNLLPGMFFWGTSIFVFFRYHFSNLKLSESKLKFLLLLSKLSFGIYLVHDFIITLLERIGITTLSYNVFISVPLNSLVVFAVSFIIIWVISKIPFLNKYII